MFKKSSNEGLKIYRVALIVGKAAVSFGKKFATNPVKAIEIASNIDMSTTLKTPAWVLTLTPDPMKFLPLLKV